MDPMRSFGMGSERPTDHGTDLQNLQQPSWQQGHEENDPVKGPLPYEKSVMQRFGEVVDDPRNQWIGMGPFGLAGGAVKTGRAMLKPLFHVTNPRNVESIMEQGVKSSEYMPAYATDRVGIEPLKKHWAGPNSVAIPVVPDHASAYRYPKKIIVGSEEGQKVGATEYKANHFGFRSQNKDVYGDPWDPNSKSARLRRRLLTSHD